MTVLVRLPTALRSRVASTALAIAGCAAVLLGWAWLGAAEVLPSTVAAVGAAAAALGLAGLVMRRLGLRWDVISIVLAGLALYLAYLGYTTAYERSYDATAHLEWIRFAADHRRLPPPDHCTTCHHPPLYPILGAVVFAGARATSLLAPERALQVLSLACFFGFLVYSARLIELWDERRSVVRLAMLLVVFWPTSVTSSVRIGNDPLLNALTVAGLFYLVRWHQTPRTLLLALSCVLAALAVLTKINGLVLVALIAVSWLSKLARRIRRRREVYGLFSRSTPALLALVVLVAGFAGWRAHSRQTGLLHGLLGRAYEKPIPANASWATTYLSFDVERYLKRPRPQQNLRLGQRPPARPFWSVWLRSSLFGTHSAVRTLRGPSSNFRSSRPLAQTMSFVLLAMTAWLGASACAARRRALEQRWHLVLVTAVFVVAAIAFHGLAPSFHHADFRFVFPVLVPLAALYALSVERARQRALAISTLGTVLALALVGLSVVHFWPPTGTPGRSPVGEWIHGRSAAGPAAPGDGPRARPEARPPAPRLSTGARRLVHKTHTDPPQREAGP